MEYKEEIRLIKKTDYLIDHNPELRKASLKILSTLLKQFNAKRGGIFLFESFDKKLVPIAKKGNANKSMVNRCFKIMKTISSGKEIAMPIAFQKQKVGVIYIGSASIDQDSERLLVGVEDMLDGRFNYEYDSTGLKRLFSRFVGEKVMKKILKNPERDHIAGEVHNCSIFFADINGFTTYANSHSAHKVVEFLNEFFEKSAPLVLENNGTIDKFIGDEIMAVFGSPIPQKHHAADALSVAKKMIKRFKPIAKKYGMNKGGLSIGIATGRVVTGTVGFDRLVDYTAIGKKVNLAARLTSEAARNEILVDETTKRSARSFIFSKSQTKTIKSFGKIKTFKCI